MTKRLPLFLFISCVALLSCDEPFEPKGPFKEQLVVYGLLNAERDTQYVRVYTTYNPDGFDPFTNMNDKQVENATVMLSGPDSVRQFQVTTVTRDDQSRYPNDIRPYARMSFTPTPGATYTLNVNLLSGEQASGTASVPGRGSISIRTSHVIVNPGGFSENIRLEARISSKTRGLLIRMYVEFEITNGSTTELRVAEVPTEIRSSNQSVYEPIFPSLQRRESTPIADLDRIEFVTFQNEAYRAFRGNLAKEYFGWSITYKRAIFILWQVEPNLYNYYNIVNGFRDEISIRTDEPDYASISGGLGVFGAMTVDTTYYFFPQ